MATNIESKKYDSLILERDHLIIGSDMKTQSQALHKHLRSLQPSPQFKRDGGLALNTQSKNDFIDFDHEWQMEAKINNRRASFEKRLLTHKQD